MTKVELLIPAKDLSVGKVAVDHGADAVYIGAPKYGARQAVGNSLQDIEQLVCYSHLYGAKVHVTLNTLLFDDEIREAQDMAYRLYEMGVDALILQDLGLVAAGLPPMAWHASTQCHNASIERLQFLQRLGFQRAILARELNLDTIRQMRANTTLELETFVHGALCVCYSGQCYMSCHANGRSGNRGACAQLCRYRYALKDAKGQTIAPPQYLLSLKDMNRSAFIPQLLQAGICSLKVEGRLKDEGYVKNVTSYYRQQLDAFLNGRENFKPSSSGHVRFFFTPNPQKSFNRGFTNYFIEGEREKMATLATPKAMGEPVGMLTKDGRGRILYKGDHQLANGDGLCFINNQDELEGFLVNQVVGNQIVPHKPLGRFDSVQVFRNEDKAFNDVLSRKTAERKIEVDVVLEPQEGGFVLQMIDEDECMVSSFMSIEHQPARDTMMVRQQLSQALSKLGNTPFQLRHLTVIGDYFIPTSLLNNLKRTVVEKLIEERIRFFKPKDVMHQVQPLPMFEEVSYKANVINESHKALYKSFGALEVAYGLEKTLDFAQKELMVCKYCLRYELGFCTKEAKGRELQPPLYLTDGTYQYRLEFDCAHCEMKILQE